MKKFLLLIILFAPVAFAQEADPDPTTMTGEQMLAYCDTKWGSKVAAATQCVIGLRLKRAEVTDSVVLARLDKGEERDVEILAELDKLGDKVDQLATKQPFDRDRLCADPSLPPSQRAVLGCPNAPIASSTGVTYTRTGGAAWVPVHQPTVVSIHSLTGMVPDTLHIMSLEHPTARKTCGGVSAPLVAFYDHGVPVSNVYAPAGAPTGFVEVYYDRDNNGTPDGTVMALDLSTQTDVWITWGLQNDLTIRYLRPGAQIAVEGLPMQWVYHPTLRAETTGAVGCDDEDTPRGGHKVDQAYSLSRMW